MAPLFHAIGNSSAYPSSRSESRKVNLRSKFTFSQCGWYRGYSISVPEYRQCIPGFFVFRNTGYYLKELSTGEGDYYDNRKHLQRRHITGNR